MRDKVTLILKDFMNCNLKNTIKLRHYLMMSCVFTKERNFCNFFQAVEQTDLEIL